MSTLPTRIEVYVDITSPAAYLAFEPIRALAERCGLQIIWGPMRTPKRKHFDLNDNTLPVAQRHQMVRQAYRDSEFERYARWRELPLTPSEGEVDASMVAAAITATQAAGIAGRFLSEAFERYWSGVPNALSASWVAGYLQKNSITAMASGEPALDAADELGLFDAPAFIIDDETFIGRQHLPVIERIAREGAAAVIPPLPNKETKQDAQAKPER